MSLRDANNVDGEPGWYFGLGSAMADDRRSYTVYRHGHKERVTISVPPGGDRHAIARAAITARQRRDWRTKDDHELDSVDVREMRAAATSVNVDDGTVDQQLTERARHGLALIGPDLADPALVETDAEKLLLEWYQQWEVRDDMPAKMGDGLHVRTAMYWVVKGHP